MAFEATNESIRALNELADGEGNTALLDAAQELRAAEQAERAAARQFGFKVCGGL